ncbi:zinc ion binding protein [Stemphylium lycopersici]|uniref:Zinc ion binding protein n=1 Tax=Stemphylium lycopersici TaxID=183478 RepID=A0A364MS25_STELY|nr:zinc ion binding protein [Stemphylium lycopersici]
MTLSKRESRLHRWAKKLGSCLRNCKPHRKYKSTYRDIEKSPQPVRRSNAQQAPRHLLIGRREQPSPKKTSSRKSNATETSPKRALPSTGRLRATPPQDAPVDETIRLVNASMSSLVVGRQEAQTLRYIGRTSYAPRDSGIAPSIRSGLTAERPKSQSEETEALRGPRAVLSWQESFQTQGVLSRELPPHPTARNDSAADLTVRPLQVRSYAPEAMYSRPATGKTIIPFQGRMTAGAQICHHTTIHSQTALHSALTDDTTDWEQDWDQPLQQRIGDSKGLWKTASQRLLIRNKDSIRRLGAEKAIRERMVARMEAEKRQELKIRSIQSIEEMAEEDRRADEEWCGSSLRFIPPPATPNFQASACGYSTVIHVGYARLLQFNRFLTEDPSLAVFSVGQEAPVSDSWRDDGRRLGCGWSGLFSSKRSQCHAAATVGSYWPFGLSNRAVLYWNAEDKVILLDWSKLYSEYFAQARSPKNKRRIERIVQRYRDLDAENMRKDTDGRWSSYGDWDIYPATHSEIAMACRYEGPLSDFEDRLDPKKERFSAHEMMLRVGDRLVAVGEAIRKRVDGKPKMYEGEDKARADYSHGPVTLWKRASYHKLFANPANAPPNISSAPLHHDSCPKVAEMSGCVICKNPLEVEVERDEDEEYAAGSSGKAPAAAPETYPDDVKLSCGCHFHWDCLLSAYEVTSCPNCSKEISTTGDGTQKVLCTLNNEGGMQEDLDILPLLIEESYLKAYPEDRKARAFLEFCRAGDYKAVIELLVDDSADDDDEDEEGDTSMGTADPEKETGIDRVLRYQDPIGEMQSGLHAAVHAQSREVAWLLLLLASNYPLLDFPTEVFQEAEAMGIMRGLTEDKVDIRSLRDGDGRTAEDIAKEVGGVWNGWVGNNRLAI